MIKNYLKIALRNLIREKLYSGINIFGLSVGAAVAILLLLYVRNELTFDAFHSKAGRTYRAWVKENVDGEIFFNTVTPFILGRELRDNFPEVEKVVRYLTVTDLVRQDNFSDQETMHLMEPGFFEVFDFPLLHGNPETALAGPGQVVITPAIARKYYGDADPLGQELSIHFGGQWLQFEVAGIIAEAPANSSLQYQLLISFDYVADMVSERGRNSWTNVWPETYVLLREGADVEALMGQVQPFIDARVPDDYGPGDYLVGLQPLTDIHLNNDFPAGAVPVSNWRYPLIMGGIALLILVLACINFITLAIGRSLSRAREVGIRKVTGATRPQLMQQFWGEAVLLTVLAFALGLGLADLLLPAFNQLAGQHLTLAYSPGNLFAVAALALGIGLIAGAYPAAVVSGFSPVTSLYGKMESLGADKNLLLRGLVVFQFVLSIGLIACSLIMQGQLRFLQNKNLGFDQEQTLVLPYQEAPSQAKGLRVILDEGRQKVELMREALAADPAVLAVTGSTHAFGGGNWMRLGYQDPASGKYRNFRVNGVDDRFIPTLGIELVAGRNFSTESGTDRRAVIINETMARTFGFADYLGQPLPPPLDTVQLIGIARDFHYASLHSPVEPMMLAMDPLVLLSRVGDVNFDDMPTIKLSVKMAAGRTAEGIAAVRDAWKRIAPDQPFAFTFVDEAVARQYESDRRLSAIVGLATLLAVLVACLGLFGMATLTVGRRTKEIGIRKVLGASVLDVVLLLNRSFITMVALATLIAAPLAWWLMYRWLQDFAYRTTISPLTFLLAGLLALAVAWLAVSYQSVRAARGNPVESLRRE